MGGKGVGFVVLYRRRGSVSFLICVAAKVTVRTVCRVCISFWFTVRVARFCAKAIYRDFSFVETLPLSKEERWRMV